MANDNRPNLFSYATSELSQDAFICWLAAWADPKYEADILHQIARKFIHSMLQKKHKCVEINTINSLTIEQQYPILDTKKRGRIDIVITLTYTDHKALKKKSVIVIEDKVDAELTGQQLDFYVSSLSKKEDFSDFEKYYIFLKTGYYDSLIITSQFKLFNRKDFIEVLELYTGTNEIIRDYISHLRAIDYQLNRFREEAMPQNYKLKNRYYLVGFHKWLFETSALTLSERAGYGHVNNSSGGFDGFWWNFEISTKNNYWSYMQLEDNKLCYKIGLSDEITKNKDWKNKAYIIKINWSPILEKIAIENNISDLSIKHTKIGKTMTLAHIDSILCLNKDDTLDLGSTIIRLRDAEEVLRKARQEIDTVFPQ